MRGYQADMPSGRTHQPFILKAYCMTEREQQSTNRPEQTHSSDYHTEDETSFVDLLEILVKKIVFILVITSVCVLLSILYAQLKIPTYEASIGFLEPQENFLSAFPPEIASNLPGYTTDKKGNKKDEISPGKASAFSMFLSKVTTYKLKREVIEKGNFMKKLYGEESIINSENATLEIHNSIRISREKENENLPSFQRPVYLKLEGTKPEAISEFLNALAQSAIQDVVNEIKDLMVFTINTEINRITMEVETAQALALEKSRNTNKQDILRLSEALVIAKNLGLKDHSFDTTKSSSNQFLVTNNTEIASDRNPLSRSKSKTEVEIKDTTLPIWFQYGERALQQELMILKSKKYHPTIQGLAESIITLKKYKAFDPSSLQIKVVTISQPSSPPSAPIKPDKTKIIVIGVVLGLLIGFLMACLSNSFDRLMEKKQSVTFK